MSFPSFTRPSAEQVVRENAAMVYRQLKRIFGPHADVEDAFQQVFVEVLRSLPSFRGAARLSTWIRRITWNVAYQEMRVQYQRPETRSFDETAAAAAADTEAELARRQARRRLYEGLETLEPKQRIAVVMHDIEGFTLKEISKTLGRPLQTVASQLHAGRARLSAFVAGEPPASATSREEVESP
jgi:RNA polymerase sigma-70 factor (ECF subfamily)